MNDYQKDDAEARQRLRVAIVRMERAVISIHQCVHMAAAVRFEHAGALPPLEMVRRVHDISISVMRDMDAVATALRMAQKACDKALDDALLMALQAPTQEQCHAG
ncbi:hypothetical protein [Methylocella sp.]|uniref:hypothetical protein n=1 Tax=Methylocella sp. TaxID=1978226 RepID=UPI0035B20150